MEYQVPQFIEVESKIIGPLTLRQFIYVAGGAGRGVVFFSYLPIMFAILLSLPVVGLVAALAFYKINGKTFAEILEAGFNYYTSQKLLIWKHTPPKKNESAAIEAAAAADAAVVAKRESSKLTRGKLSELAWSLDVPTDSDQSES